MGDYNYLNDENQFKDVTRDQKPFGSPFLDAYMSLKGLTPYYKGLNNVDAEIKEEIR